MFVSIGKAARIMGVSKTTMRRWDKEGLLRPAFRTKGGHRRYNPKTLMAENNTTRTIQETVTKQQENTTSVVIYSRVSSSKQREDLKRQTKRLEKFVEGHQWQLVKKYQDIGSGLNDQRKGLLKMIRELSIIQPEKIVCSYLDGLARFGTGLIKTIGELFDTEIVFAGKNKA